MATKHDQAGWLAQLLTEYAGIPVTVTWESEGVARGVWRTRWTDGPTTAAMRDHAAGQQPFLHPLNISELRWTRDYSPRAWALALLAERDADPGLSDWRELLGLAEARLDTTDEPDHTSDRHTDRATRLLAAAGDRESSLAQATLATGAGPPPGTGSTCPVCQRPLPARTGAGRPGRYCSPACRTRAWRARTTTVTKTRDEIGCRVCGRPVTARTGAGRPSRYCSPACRTRAWRARTTTVTQSSDEIDRRRTPASETTTGQSGDNPASAPRVR